MAGDLFVIVLAFSLTGGAQRRSELPEIWMVKKKKLFFIRLVLSFFRAAVDLDRWPHQ